MMFLITLFTGMSLALAAPLTPTSRPSEANESLLLSLSVESDFGSGGFELRQSSQNNQPNLVKVSNTRVLDRKPASKEILSRIEAVTSALEAATAPKLPSYCTDWLLIRRPSDRGPKKQTDLCLSANRELAVQYSNLVFDLALFFSSAKAQ